MSTKRPKPKAPKTPPSVTLPEEVEKRVIGTVPAFSWHQLEATSKQPKAKAPKQGHHERHRDAIQRHARHKSAARRIPGIEQTPGVCGGAACIRQTRIPVWVLVRGRQLGMTEAELLDDYPSLQAQDLVNAWAYVETHNKEIEQQILMNESA
jgi:uncharacterized protein (DUF433 family)